jgi:hypothetical protein
MKAMKATAHRQGSGWIVIYWDAGIECWRETGEMSWWAARSMLGSENGRRKVTI